MVVYDFDRSLRRSSFDILPSLSISHLSIVPEQCLEEVIHHAKPNRLIACLPIVTVSRERILQFLPLQSPSACALHHFFPIRRNDSTRAGEFCFLLFLLAQGHVSLRRLGLLGVRERRPWYFLPSGAGPHGHVAIALISETFSCFFLFGF